jgi:hypothetical protein
MAKLTTAQRRAMPAKEFAGGKPKGEKTGRFPLNDKAHIKAAESYERFATPAEKQKIDAAAAKAFPKRGERTETNKRTRANGPGGEVRHPQDHDEFMRLGND